LSVSRELLAFPLTLQPVMILLSLLFLASLSLLKVDGNEKMTGVGKEIVLQTRSGIVAIESYLQFERFVPL
jgi:hypothetical protein